MPRWNTKPWTKEEYKTLERLRGDGVASREIARLMGRSYRSVVGQCHLQDIPKVNTNLIRWADQYAINPSARAAARVMGKSVSMAAKMKAKVADAGYPIFSDPRAKRYNENMNKTWPKFATTKYKELGYCTTGRRAWRFVDLTNRNPDPSPIGPTYPSEGKLLENLKAYAALYGCLEPETDPFVTQDEVDGAVAQLAALSERCERTRDGMEHESRPYWHWHDCMIAIDMAIEEFLPKGKPK